MEFAVLGAISTIFGMAITYLTFIRGRDKTVKESAEENAKVSTKLDHISRGVDDIRIDLKASEKQINTLGERVAKVEESTKSVNALGERVAKVEEATKSAHKRIDKLEGNSCEN